MANETDLRLKYKQEAGDILITGIVNVINESLRNIFLTKIGSRLFNRRFGSNLANLLFEPMSELVSEFILIEIQQTIDRLEPRIRIDYNNTQIVPDYDNNLYRLQLTYTIIESENIGEFNLVLERSLQ